MNLSDLFTNTLKLVKSNTPEILTAAAVSGVITTSYLTAKASFSAAEVLKDTDVPDDRKERIKEQVKHVWRLYIPAGISGVVTIGCVIGAAKGNSRRTAAAVTAYSLTEKAFSEYKEKVVEQVGKNKEQAIRDSLANDRVSDNPPQTREVLVLGTGHVLCCELYTHRYFRSDMETLRKAMNDINVKIINEPYVTLDEFYYIIGLPGTTHSNDVGWTSDKLLSFEFSAIMSADDEPCLAFAYNYVKPLK